MKESSFIHTARRAQLVDCAIEVIAELGYERASTVRIAQRAGVSRGVLTYHFRDRAELINEVVKAVYALAVQEFESSAQDAPTPRDELLRFIGGSVDFYAAYPRHMAALNAIYTAGRPGETPDRPTTAQHSEEIAVLTDVLRRGQRDGLFRDFDAEFMFHTIRAALDVAVRHIIQGADAQPIRDELVRTFDAATRREGS